MATELFAHIPTGTVTSGGTGAPAPGTSESWTVTAATAFPAATASAQFHVCDPAANTELILVTVAPGGAGAGQSWTVTRGADGTTPVAHTAGFTIYQVTPASFLNAPRFNGNVSTPGLLTTAGFATAVKTVTAAYTATANDFFIEGDTSVTGTFTVTLPTSNVQTGQVYVVKKIDGSSAEVDVTPATGTIDGRSSIPLLFFNSWTVAQWDGSTWKVVGGYFLTGGFESTSVSYLQSGIAVGLVRTVTAAYTVQPNDFEIQASASGGAFTVTLSAGALFAQIVVVKKTDSTGNAVTVSPGAGTIDGAASVTLTGQYQALLVQWDGSNWQVLAADGVTRNSVLDDGAGNLKAAASISTAGLAGATAASRYAGATTSGAPGSGTFAKGDYVIDQTGAIWVCTTAGSPGTWTQVGGGGAFLPLAGGTMTGDITLAAGTTSLAPLTFQSGTNLTTATAGDVEYDGASTYMTNETTSGRGLVSVEQKFRLTATGSAISTIANYFGTTSNISLVANAEYEIEIDAWFLKTTAGNVTWTFTNSAAPTAMNLEYKLSPTAGIVTAAAATTLFGDQYDITAAAATVTLNSLSASTNHHHRFWIRLINGAGTSLQIQIAASAGTVTPGINSAWTCRRVPAANVGHFAA